MTLPVTLRPTLRELLDLPQRLGTQDYVLKLSQAINDPVATAKSYVATEQLARCFDEALTLVRDALGIETGFTESKAAYLHGSFGAGKSHFMAMLYLLLHGDPAARSMKVLADVVSRHSDWTNGRKFLLVTYHMSDATTLEDRLLGGYVDRVRELYPDAAPPAVYRSDALLEDARNLRASMGDDTFFRLLNAGISDDGWGDLSGWNAASFDYAANAPHRDDEHRRLVSDLARNVIRSARQTAEFIDIDEGLSLISRHARTLGYDAVILFLDEVMLWLASRSADEAAKEVPKLAKLVEGAKADRPAPLVSFLARQRSFKELLGQGRIGEEQAKVEEGLEFWAARFRTITLEDRNLPEIVQKRLLRRKDSAAEQLISAEFEKALRIGGSVLDTLITRSGDREQFRKLYPFTPAFMEVLVGAAAALQRQRTGLRILSEILDQNAGRLRLGDIVPVGDLFRAMEKGSDPMTGQMQQLFEYARAVWKRLRAQIEHDVGATFDDFDKLPAAQQQQLRTQERIAGTLILAALVPNLESFRDLNGGRLAALNYGSVQTRIPGTEGQQVLAICRRWASQGLVQLKDPGSSTTTISVELTSVDVNAILEAASKAYESYGNLARKAGDLLFEDLKIETDDNFEASHKFTWRGTKRHCQISSFNVHEASAERLRPLSENSDWLVVIDTPVYKAGHGPADHLQKLREFGRQNPEGVRTLVWVPAALSERVLKDLGRLAILDHLLSPRFDKLKEYSAHLSAVEREQARSILSAMQRELTVSVKSALAQAYGVGTILPANLDQSYPLSPADQFQSLEPDLRLQRPSAGTVDKALEQLLHQALDWQFPAHPDFKTDELPSGGIGRRFIEKVFENLSDAIRDENRRKSLPQRLERLQLCALLEPLRLAQVTDQYLMASLDYWYAHFERAHHDAGGGVITVSQLRKYIDKPKSMGLETDLQDLVILFYAAWTNRSFRAKWGATDPKIGNLKDDWELVQEQLPSREAWEAAITRASAVLGVPVPSTSLNAATLASFKKRVQEDAAKLVEPTNRLIGQLNYPESDRHKTAYRSRDLLEKLTSAKTAIEVVAAFETAPTDVPDKVLARSINQAADVADELAGPSRRVVDTLSSISVEPYAQAAKSIVQTLQQALQANEYVKPLVAALHKAVTDATSLLADLHKAAAPTRPTQTTTPPANGTPQRSKKVIAQGTTTARRQELDSVFAEIRSKVASDNAEVVLTWEVLSDE